MAGLLPIPWHDMSSFPAEVFNTLPQQYINVAIDETLYKFSGKDSNAQLYSFSSELRADLGDKVPGYISTTGSILGKMPVPNAVGAGALLISLILQLVFDSNKGTTQQESPANMLRRIFAEEKASEVRDLMDEYLKLGKAHLRDQNQLLLTTDKVEKDLSMQLTRLKNSMLGDGHMTSRSMKHWVNGAAFHVQMLIHKARLLRAEPERFETAKTAAKVVAEIYSNEYSNLMGKYKEYKTSKFNLVFDQNSCIGFHTNDDCGIRRCWLNDPDLPNAHRLKYHWYCKESAQKYVDYIFSKHPHIQQLNTYFSDLKLNVDELCSQDSSFQLS